MIKSNDKIDIDIYGIGIIMGRPGRSNEKQCN